MEWTETLKRTVDYLEEHLLEDGAAERAAQAVYLSPLYLQKGFKLVTGYSMGEYVRNRRLYLAGLEAIAGREKVIDLAYRYGYDTPESFSKAFSRFHGGSPTQLRQHPERLVSDPVLKGQLKGSMLCRKGEGAFSLADPFRTDRPLRLNALFCLSQVERWEGRPHLVWTFDQEGRPKIPNKSG